MGDVKTFKDFLKWGIENYPAEHYFIVIFNHGFGWHGQDPDDMLRNRPNTYTYNRSITHTKIQPAHATESNEISLDDTTGHTISTPELGEALNYAARLIGHKVDIYGSDACFMAMAEIADEMKDAVDYYVGSEEVEVADTWPVTAWLTEWQKNAGCIACRCCKITCKFIWKICPTARCKSRNSANHSDTLCL